MSQTYISCDYWPIQGRKLGRCYWCPWRSQQPQNWVISYSHKGHLLYQVSLKLEMVTSIFSFSWSNLTWTDPERDDLLTMFQNLFLQLWLKRQMIDSTSLNSEQFSSFSVKFPNLRAFCFEILKNQRGDPIVKKVIGFWKYWFLGKLWTKKYL